MFLCRKLTFPKLVAANYLVALQYSNIQSLEPSYSPIVTDLERAFNWPVLILLIPVSFSVSIT